MKQTIVYFLRKMKLLVFVDNIKFFFTAVIHLRSKLKFLKNNPHVILPPAYILYESFGKLDYNSYYFESRESAGEIISLIQKHIEPNNIKICEWGCGPVRLLRHFNYHLRDYNVDLYGTDFNKKTIEWCKQNFTDITFMENKLHPPLDFPENYFDVVYCVSVFTHLSKELQVEWLNECLRIIKQHGIFLLTVHGDSCSKKLLKNEKKDYYNIGYVMRGKVQEGKRNFVSYNNPSYMKNVLLKDKNIIEFIPGYGMFKTYG